MVRDVQRFQNYVLHIGVLESGDLNVGDCVKLEIEQVSTVLFSNRL